MASYNPSEDVSRGKYSITKERRKIIFNNPEKNTYKVPTELPTSKKFLDKRSATTLFILSW